MNWIDWILLKLLRGGLDPTMTLPGDHPAVPLSRGRHGRSGALWLAALLLVSSVAIFSHLWVVWWTSPSTGAEFLRMHWIEFSAAGGCFLSTFRLAAHTGS